MNLPARIEKLEGQAVERSTAVSAALTAVPCARGPVRTPSDVVELLAAEVEGLRRDVRIAPAEKALAIGRLAAVALRAMDAAASDVRLEAVERVLKLRQAAQRIKRGKE